MTYGPSTAQQLPRLSQPRGAAADEETAEHSQITHSVAALDGLQTELLGKLDVLRFGTRLPKERLVAAALGESFLASLPRHAAPGQRLQKSSSASCVKACRDARVERIHAPVRHGAEATHPRSAIEEDCATPISRVSAAKGRSSSQESTTSRASLPPTVTAAVKRTHDRRPTPAREPATRNGHLPTGPVDSSGPLGAPKLPPNGRRADGATRATDGFAKSVAARGRATDEGQTVSTGQASSTRSTALATGMRKSESSPCLLGPPAPPTPAARVDPEAGRPSLLQLTLPTNLNEARKTFFENGCTIAPKFEYNIPEDALAKLFSRYSEVCFNLLDEAKRILKIVRNSEGGCEAFEKKVNGDLQIPPYHVREMIVAYIQELGLESRVDVRVVDGAMSPASIAKKGELYVINIKNQSVSKGIIQGICDHEIGTHLLRMINDELQIWHGHRVGLADPLATEEGLATLNQHLSWPCKLFYTQALSYFAVCRGVELGFVELFQELMAGYVGDPIRCWDICCRTKRGLVDTAMPGSFFKEQVYFKGMVELLSRIDDVDLRDLYSGQVALSDLGGAASPIRRKDVQLPLFLDSNRKREKYREHCKELIRVNKLEKTVRRY